MALLFQCCNHRLYDISLQKLHIQLIRNQQPYRFKKIVLKPIKTFSCGDMWCHSNCRGILIVESFISLSNFKKINIIIIHYSMRNESMYLIGSYPAGLTYHLKIISNANVVLYLLTWNVTSLFSLLISRRTQIFYLATSVSKTQSNYFQIYAQGIIFKKGL